MVRRRDGPQRGLNFVRRSGNSIRFVLAVRCSPAAWNQSRSPAYPSSKNEETKLRRGFPKSEIEKKDFCHPVFSFFGRSCSRGAGGPRNFGDVVLGAAPARRQGAMGGRPGGERAPPLLPISALRPSAPRNVPRLGFLGSPVVRPRTSAAPVVAYFGTPTLVPPECPTTWFPRLSRRSTTYECRGSKAGVLASWPTTCRERRERQGLRPLGNSPGPAPAVPIRPERSGCHVRPGLGSPLGGRDTWAFRPDMCRGHRLSLGHLRRRIAFRWACPRGGYPVFPGPGDGGRIEATMG